MKTIDAINLLVNSGYIVEFRDGYYNVTIEKLKYVFNRIELVRLASDLLFFG